MVNSINKPFFPQQLQPVVMVSQYTSSSNGARRELPFLKCWNSTNPRVQSWTSCHSVLNSSPWKSLITPNSSLYVTIRPFYQGTEEHLLSIGKTAFTKWCNCKLRIKDQKNWAVCLDDSFRYPSPYWHVGSLSIRHLKSIIREYEHEYE